MTLVILMFFAFTLFMWFKIASLHCYLATLVTFKSRTNILVCSQQLFLSCFMITLFTFKHSWQGLCGESTQPNNVFSWNMSLTETIKIKLHLNIISTYWAPLFVYLFRSFLSHWSHLYLNHSCWLCWDLIFELLYYRTSYIHILSHHRTSIKLACYPSLF